MFGRWSAVLGPGFDSRFPRGDFSGSSHTNDFKIDTPLATLPGAWCVGSVLALVGPVTIFGDWVRYRVGSAASISVMQQVQLSEQICP